MSNNLIMMKTYKISLILLLFVVLLTGGRVHWTMAFMQKEQPRIEQGRLDLTGGKLPADYAITLDGEWEFYPHAWLIDTESGVRLEDAAASSGAYFHVPGNWSTAMDSSEPTPFGYGSYRLRILVDPDDPHAGQRFSIRIPSVRSSSQVYVNGQLLTQSGRPAQSAERYTAKNEPMTATFYADENGSIEVIIQAANYKDFRGGGIIRSTRFGIEDIVRRETSISNNMQYLVAIVILVTALQAIILYLVGTRDTKLLYFALSLFALIFVLLLSTDDKVLHNILPISYDWSFKLMASGYILVIFFMFKVFEKLNILPPRFQALVAPAYSVFCGVAFICMLVLPFKPMLYGHSTFIALSMPIVLITFVYLFRSHIKGQTDNIFIMLASIALANHFAWYGFFLLTGIKVIFYPFDLVVSLIACTSIWFKGYFLTLAETRDLASQLHRQNQYKDEFLANTSHELRNPLHGILSMSYAVLERERGTMQEASLKELELVQSVGRRMSYTLNTLLDVTKLKESGIALQTKPLTLHSLASSALEVVRYLSEGKPIRLANRIPPSFPLVMADENRTVQILFNLLHNAVKFTQQGEVAIEAVSRGGYAYISVRDTGVGISDEAMARIFKPYEQGAVGIDIALGGFGLGLSICKQLAELHGGSLQASSRPGEGSVFTFSLPLAAAGAAGTAGAGGTSGLSERTDAATAVGQQPLGELVAAWNAAAGASEAGTETAAAVGRMTDKPRILAVDDELINLQVLASILSVDQYHIVTAQSGQQALKQLHDMEWDLVISDVMMPTMSGFELTRRIRDQFSVTELPILLLTARSQLENIEIGFNCGANDYVTKPVEAIELRARVRALTGASRSAREKLRIESAWLQAQIEPHFLLNTLNSIIALSNFDTVRMRELLNAFGSFLQQKYRFQNTDELVPLEYELDLIRSYLFIEKQRFEERIQVNWHIDPHLRLELPPLTIQPLVENAVKHGILKRSKGGTVTIQIADSPEYAEITVADDGVGMDAKTIAHLFDHHSNHREGIALRNIEMRLKRLYGSGLQIISEPGQGTKISFRIMRSA